MERRAPQTFETKTDAEVWLSQVEADLSRGNWQDPDAGAVNFEVYASQWVQERGLSPTTNELYRRLLRLHILPTFGGLDLDEITSPRVRTWRTERLTTTEAPTTVAKAYRLLKAIMQTATDDELIRRNPCRIRGAGKEVAPERPVATVEQVDALANAIGVALEADGLPRCVRPAASGRASRAAAAGRRPGRDDAPDHARLT